MGHVDNTLNDLARNKLLSLFKGRARDTIIRKFRQKDDGAAGTVPALSRVSWGKVLIVGSLAECLPSLYF